MTSRARTLLVALGLVLAIVVLYLTTGRGGGFAVDGPVVSHDEGWSLGGGGSDALIGGTLEYVAGCLLIDGRPVVWPDGTSWDEEQRDVLSSTGWFGDSHRISPRAGSDPGDTVNGAGGVLGEQPDPLAPDSDIGRALGDCLGSEGVLVFNADSELDVTKAFS